MAIAELIQQSDVAYSNFTEDKKVNIVNDEKLEMGLESSKILRLEIQENYYSAQIRKNKLESYGYKELSIEDISKELFGQILPTTNIKRSFQLSSNGLRKFVTDYGVKNGSTDLKLSLYVQPKFPSNSHGSIEHPIYGRWVYFIPRNLDDSARRLIEKEYQEKKKKELISYDGYADKISYLAKSGIFRKARPLGYISSPSYLNQPIPAELLARMEDLARSRLINCFLAAGYEKAFSFNEPKKIEIIDPIILAVIDDGFGICSPMNPNTHMYFVGKYN